jgi:preprotein translocase subunit SecD
VWFNYSWRTFVIRLIVGFAAAIPLGVLASLFTRVPAVQQFAQLLIATV